MKVKIPFYEEKTDVQLSFWGKAKSHLSEDEKRSQDILADYFTSCTIKFVGKNEHEYISMGYICQNEHKINWLVNVSEMGIKYVK